MKVTGFAAVLALLAVLAWPPNAGAQAPSPASADRIGQPEAGTPSPRRTASRPEGTRAASQNTRPDEQPPVEAESPRRDRAQTGNAPTVERAQETRRFVFGRPIIRIAQDYRLPEGERAREVRSVLADAIIEGRVDADVVVVMGSARVGPSAEIGGSLVVVGGSATIDPGATINHDLVVVGGTLTAPAQFSPGGEHVVIGNAWIARNLRDMMPWITGGLLLGRPIVPALDWVWTIVLIFFVLYLALNIILDRPVSASADMVTERPLSAFMVGLLVLLLTIPAIAIIAASVIGVVIIPFLLCALVLAGLVGKTAVARAIGRGVLHPKRPNGRIQAFFTFVLGFGVLTVAYMVPVIGILTWGLTGVLGFGAATSTFRGYLRRERHPDEPSAAGAPAAPPTAAAPVEGAAPFTPDTPPPAASAAHMASAPVVSVPAPPPPVVVTPPPAAEGTPRVEPLPPPPPPQPSRFTEGLAQYPRATFLDRTAAFALDCLLVAIANDLLELTRYEGSFLLLLLVYHIAFWAWRGTTLGGIVCALRVVRTHGADLRPVDAIVRGLASVFSLGALGIGCFWMLTDAERQTWHDKIAGTLVVKVPRELVLP